MNWVDYMLLALLVASLFMGMRTGLIETAFVAVGALIGWQLAGQFADDIGALFEGTPVADTWVTVISYFIIIVLTMAVVRYIAKFVKPLLTVFTVGLSAMVDKLGGTGPGACNGPCHCGGGHHPSGPIYLRLRVAAGGHYQRGDEQGPPDRGNQEGPGKLPGRFNHSAGVHRHRRCRSWKCAGLRALGLQGVA